MRIGQECIEITNSATETNASLIKGKRYLKGTKYWLGMEMVENSLKIELAKYINIVYARMTYYPHQYVSEVSLSSFHDIQSSESWCPNSINNAGDDV